MPVTVYLNKQETLEELIVHGVTIPAQPLLPEVHKGYAEVKDIPLNLMSVKYNGRNYYINDGGFYDGEYYTANIEKGNVVFRTKDSYVLYQPD